MLPDPFVVCATQNPIEYEGTYPLPEAQLDRFLLKLTVGLPSREDEVKVLVAHDGGFDPRDLSALSPVPVPPSWPRAALRACGQRLPRGARLRRRRVPRHPHLAVAVARGLAPRRHRAARAGKAWAWLSGRDYLTPDDVKALARPTLRHRVSVRPEAELEGVTGDGVLDGVLSSVPVPR
jgi:MoxR-like ATPase